MTAWPAASEPLTVRELDAIPENGRRHELIDGTLIVSPAPGRWHQRVVLLLAFALERSCPGDLGVVLGPFAVRPNDVTELRPDVLVAARADLTEANLPAAPRLAVEVLSPSSVVNDLHSKKAIYERIGTPSYWVIDPDVPALTAFELDERGRYQCVADVSGATAFEATQPFPVRIVPADLLGRRPEPEQSASLVRLPSETSPVG